MESTFATMLGDGGRGVVEEITAKLCTSKPEKPVDFCIELLKKRRLRSPAAGSGASAGAGKEGARLAGIALASGCPPPKMRSSRCGLRRVRSSPSVPSLSRHGLRVVAPLSTGLRIDTARRPHSIAGDFLSHCGIRGVLDSLSSSLRAVGVSEDKRMAHCESFFRALKGCRSLPSSPGTPSREGLASGGASPWNPLLMDETMLCMLMTNPTMIGNVESSPPHRRAVSLFMCRTPTGQVRGEATTVCCTLYFYKSGHFRLNTSGRVPNPRDGMQFVAVDETCRGLYKWRMPTAFDTLACSVTRALDMPTHILQTILEYQVSERVVELKMKFTYNTPSAGIRKPSVQGCGDVTLKGSLTLPDTKYLTVTGFAMPGNMTPRHERFDDTVQRVKLISAALPAGAEFRKIAGGPVICCEARREEHTPRRSDRLKLAPPSPHHTIESEQEDESEEEAEEVLNICQN